MRRKCRLPSLTSLRNFEAVARYKSFTKAADELCVTQGAVSHQVKILEEELRARLLIRGRLGVELTPSGLKLLDAAREAFDDLAIVVGEIRDEAAITRKGLTLQVSPQFCQFWLAPRLTKFSAENPDIEVHISAARQTSLLKTDDQALMIVPGSDDQSPSADRLFSSNLMPLCSPVLLGKRTKAGDPSVLQQTALLCETDHDWWSDWNAMVGEQQALTDKRLYFDDPAAMVHVAASGCGVLMGSAQLLRDYIVRNQLVAPLDPSLHISRAYHLAYCTKAMSSSPAQAFRSWLLNEVKLDTRLHESA